MYPLSALPAAARPPDRLMEAARQIEATFLSQMLESAGLGQTPELGGGGAGEAQFASLLRDLQARQMVDAGGIGLAEVIFQSLSGANHD